MMRTHAVTVKLLLTTFLGGLIFSVIAPFSAKAASGFSLQVTPSPLITSVTPGETKTEDIRIHNTGDQAENLKVSLRSFTTNGNSDKISLDASEPSSVKDWVTFANPTFTIEAGQWFTERVTFAAPKDAGFNYSFAIVISRQTPTKPAGGQATLEGSVAIFTLLTVNRPDAKRQLSIEEVSIDKRVFEYLPMTISVKFKNSGNTFVQPQGNIFIGRSAQSNPPLAILPLNSSNGFVLPDTSRTFAVTWQDGFPVYSKTDSKQGLAWDWNKLGHLRIGRYTAKVIAVYDDGQRDVPLESQVSFWVIPWKILLGSALVLVLVGIGLFTIIKKLFSLTHRKKKHEIKVL